MKTQQYLTEAVDTRILGVLAIPVVLVLFLLLSTPASAQRPVTEEPQTFLTPDGVNLILEECAVSVEATPPTARVTVQQVLRNPRPQRVEGEYLIPVPEGCALSDFTFWMNGKAVRGEVMESGQARRVFEDIVRRIKDPALLEYVGHNLFRVHIFPIPPNDKAQIRFTWTAPLTREGEAWLCPLPMVPGTVKSFVLKGEGGADVVDAYTPDLALETQSGRGRISFAGEAKDFRPAPRFGLYLVPARGSLGFAFMTFDDGNEDPYFLALLAPKASEDALPPPKTVVFVLDTSGSMEGEKMEQAKKALAYGVQQLSEGDRFSIVTFSSGVRPWSDRPRAADASAKKEGRAFIGRIQASGGTNLHGALQEALAQVRGESGPAYLVLLTDGLPTVGPADTPAFLKLLKGIPPNLRFFTFGVGNDVNAALLDVCARDGRGISSYVAPAENLEVPLGAFFEKMSRPVLTSVKVSFDGFKAYDVYPEECPDLFAGQSLTLLGRSRGGVRGSLELTGVLNGKPVKLRYGVAAAADGGQESLPKLWATRKVGALLEDYRIHPSEEVRKEIVDTAVRFGILTPLTSGLVVEDTADQARRLTQGSPEGQPKGDAPVFLAPSSPSPSGIAGGVEKSARKKAEEARAQTGESGVASSRQVQDMKYSEVVVSTQPPAPGPTAPGSRDESGLADHRTVGSHTFYLRGSVWTDSLLKSGMREKKIAYQSDDYYAFFKENPGLKGVMGLGENVVVVVKDTAYRISPK